MGRELIGHVIPHLEQQFVMYLEEGMGHLAQAPLVHVVVDVSHCDFHGSLSRALNRKVTGFSQNTGHDPLKDTSDSGNVQDSSPLIPQITVFPGPSVIILPHSEDARIRLVKAVEDVLAVVLVPERLELGARRLMGFAFGMAVPTHGWHLFKKADVGYVVDGREDARFRREAVGFLIDTGVVPTPSIMVARIWESKSRDSEVRVDVLFLFVDAG